LSLIIDLFYVVFQDQDVLHSWLMDIRFEEYFPLFVAAGYDMHTISRMTPEVSLNNET
jgi:SAM domain (Sterile alpha motif).